MSESLATQQDYQELVSQLANAEREFEATKLAVANTMAEAIVADGGMSIHIEQFVLAMHGVAGYTSRNTWGGGSGAPESYLEENSVFQLYDTLEESVTRSASTIMMHRDKQRFAYVPDYMRYPEDGNTSIGRQPLRFLIRREPAYSRDAVRYNGHVVLPVLTVDETAHNEAASAIKLASFYRDSDRLETKDRRLYTTDYREEWHIGKGAIVAASIQDYRTDLVTDRNFLYHLDDATQTLRSNAQLVHDESMWDNVWQQSSRTYSAD